MSSNGGNMPPTLSRDDFRTEVAREAEFLLRTMRGDTGDNDSAFYSASGSEQHGVRKKKSGKLKMDAVEAALAKEQLVPDAEDLWG